MKHAYRSRFGDGSVSREPAPEQVLAARKLLHTAAAGTLRKTSSWHVHLHAVSTKWSSDLLCSCVSYRDVFFASVVCWCTNL